MRALYQKGVTYVVQPEFEASLEIINQIFLNLGISADRMKEITEEAREELTDLCAIRVLNSIITTPKV